MSKTSTVSTKKFNHQWIITSLLSIQTNVTNNLLCWSSYTPQQKLFLLMNVYATMILYTVTNLLVIQKTNTT